MARKTQAKRSGKTAKKTGKRTPSSLSAKQVKLFRHLMDGGVKDDSTE